MRSLLWQSDAWAEYESLQAEKQTLKKVNKLLKDIMRNGYQCSYAFVYDNLDKELPCFRYYLFRLLKAILYDGLLNMDSHVYL